MLGNSLYLVSLAVWADERASVAAFPEGPSARVPEAREAEEAARAGPHGRPLRPPLLRPTGMGAIQ